MSYVYIIKCADGTYYTGWTKNLEKRVRAHNSGQGAKYTRSRRPVELVYYEEYGEESEARKREYAVKQLTRSGKEALMRRNDTLMCRNDALMHCKDTP